MLFIFLIFETLLHGKKILIGITGSIAAYKSIYLVRLLVRAGAEVRVILTPAAKDFISPLTLSTLSKQPVVSDLFNEESWANHVMHGRWADMMLIAPCSCNTLAKMANGQCDNLLLATYLSATCPVVVAPAMDEDMWHHPATKQNLDKIASFGNMIIPVEKGELASGLYGEGRMAEPEQIIKYVEENFFLTRKLEGKKVFVAAGPTYEPIDPVRFIGNNSSGKMGIALAHELHHHGADVTLVMGPSYLDFSENELKLVKVITASEMFDVCVKLFKDSEIGIMAAAVSDYTPVFTSDKKIKKKEDKLVIELTKTKDILKTLGNKKKPGQLLVGFALETTDEKKYALDKLDEKNADLIVLNSLNDEGAGFGHDTNKISIFAKNGKEFHFETKSKIEVAKDIVNTLIQLYYV